jgi:hypothetical protein
VVDARKYVANGHDRGGSAADAGGVSYSASVLPSVSGTQCAYALQQAGFQLELHDPDHILVRLHGAPVVRVPLVDELKPVQMAGILRLTGLSAEEFVGLLAGQATSISER